MDWKCSKKPGARKRAIYNALCGGSSVSGTLSRGSKRRPPSAACGNMGHQELSAQPLYKLKDCLNDMAACEQILQGRGGALPPPLSSCGFSPQPLEEGGRQGARGGASGPTPQLLWVQPAAARRWRSPGARSRHMAALLIGLGGLQPPPLGSCWLMLMVSVRCGTVQVGFLHRGRWAESVSRLTCFGIGVSSSMQAPGKVAILHRGRWEGSVSRLTCFGICVSSSMQAPGLDSKIGLVMAYLKQWCEKAMMVHLPARRVHSFTAFSCTVLNQTSPGTWKNISSMTVWAERVIPS